jgi:prepilin-type N-terminal cleavage/methylation domain-containing protein
VHKQCRAKSGFTLVEILIVVAVIGLLAALATPNFLKAWRRAQNARFVADLRVAVSAFDMRCTEKGCFPPDTTPGQMPQGMTEYLAKMRWTEDTPIGGQWDWDNGQFGSKAGVSVYQPTVADKQMEEIDLLIDDGDLATGVFRKRSDGFIYILER